MEQKTEELAKKIWEYHHMNQQLMRADCILVMGGHDTRVAERGAELFLEGWAPLMVFSGGVAHEQDLLKTGLDKPEAEVFAAIAVNMGVPTDKILIENKSTNTGENILFTKRLLEEKGIDPRRFIAVQKPYMERRAYATFRKLWPEKEVVVTSPAISFEAYPNQEISVDKVINIMVGDLQRIKIYAEKGFQIEQEIPDDIRQAYQELVKAGYDKHLLSDGKI